MNRWTKNFASVTGLAALMAVAACSGTGEKASGSGPAGSNAAVSACCQVVSPVNGRDPLTGRLTAVPGVQGTSLTGGGIPFSGSMTNSASRVLILADTSPTDGSGVFENLVLDSGTVPASTSLGYFSNCAATVFTDAAVCAALGACATPATSATCKGVAITGNIGSRNWKSATGLNAFASVDMGSAFVAYRVAFLAPGPTAALTDDVLLDTATSVTRRENLSDPLVANTLVNRLSDLVASADNTVPAVAAGGATSGSGVLTAGTWLRPLPAQPVSWIESNSDLAVAGGDTTLKVASNNLGASNVDAGDVVTVTKGNNLGYDFTVGPAPLFGAPPLRFVGASPSAVPVTGLFAADASGVDYEIFHANVLNTRELEANGVGACASANNSPGTGCAAAVGHNAARAGTALVQGEAADLDSDIAQITVSGANAVLGQASNQKAVLSRDVNLPNSNWAADLANQVFVVERTAGATNSYLTYQVTSGACAGSGAAAIYTAALPTFSINAGCLNTGVAGDENLDGDVNDLVNAINVGRPASEQFILAPVPVDGPGTVRYTTVQRDTKYAGDIQIEYVDATCSPTEPTTVSSTQTIDGLGNYHITISVELGNSGCGPSVVAADAVSIAAAVNASATAGSVVTAFPISLACPVAGGVCAAVRAASRVGAGFAAGTLDVVNSPVSGTVRAVIPGNSNGSAPVAASGPTPLIGATSTIGTGSVTADSGTVAAAAAASVTLAASATTTVGALVGYQVTITGGPGAGQVRTIVGYAAPPVATVSPAWAVLPTAASTYSVGSRVLGRLVTNNPQVTVGVLTDVNPGAPVASACLPSGLNPVDDLGGATPAVDEASSFRGVCFAGQLTVSEGTTTFTLNAVDTAGNPFSAAVADTYMRDTAPLFLDTDAGTAPTAAPVLPPFCTVGFTNEPVCLTPASGSSGNYSTFATTITVGGKVRDFTPGTTSYDTTAAQATRFGYVRIVNDTGYDSFTLTTDAYLPPFNPIAGGTANPVPYVNGDAGGSTMGEFLYDNVPLRKGGVTNFTVTAWDEAGNTTSFQFSVTQVSANATTAPSLEVDCFTENTPRAGGAPVVCPDDTDSPNPNSPAHLRRGTFGSPAERDAALANDNPGAAPTYTNNFIQRLNYDDPAAGPAGYCNIPGVCPNGHDYLAPLSQRLISADRMTLQGRYLTLEGLQPTLYINALPGLEISPQLHGADTTDGAYPFGFFSFTQAGPPAPCTGPIPAGGGCGTNYIEIPLNGATPTEGTPGDLPLTEADEQLRVGDWVVLSTTDATQAANVGLFQITGLQLLGGGACNPAGVGVECRRISLDRPLPADASGMLVRAEWTWYTAKPLEVPNEGVNSYTMLAVDALGNQYTTVFSVTRDVFPPAVVIQGAVNNQQMFSTTPEVFITDTSLFFGGVNRTGQATGTAAVPTSPATRIVVSRTDGNGLGLSATPIHYGYALYQDDLSTFAPGFPAPEALTPVAYDIANEDAQVVADPLAFTTAAVQGNWTFPPPLPGTFTYGPSTVIGSARAGRLIDDPATIRPQTLDGDPSCINIASCAAGQSMSYRIDVQASDSVGLQTNVVINTDLIEAPVDRLLGGALGIVSGNPAVLNLLTDNTELSILTMDQLSLSGVLFNANKALSVLLGSPSQQSVQDNPQAFFYVDAVLFPDGTPRDNFGVLVGKILKDPDGNSNTGADAPIVTLANVGRILADNGVLDDLLPVIDNTNIFDPRTGAPPPVNLGLQGDFSRMQQFTRNLLIDSSQTQQCGTKPDGNPRLCFSTAGIIQQAFPAIKATLDFGDLIANAAAGSSPRKRTLAAANLNSRLTGQDLNLGVAGFATDAGAVGAVSFLPLDSTAAGAGTDCQSSNPVNPSFRAIFDEPIADQICKSVVNVQPGDILVIQGDEVPGGPGDSCRGEARRVGGYADSAARGTVPIDTTNLFSAACVAACTGNCLYTIVASNGPSLNPVVELADVLTFGVPQNDYDNFASTAAAAGAGDARGGERELLSGLIHSAEESLLNQTAITGLAGTATRSLVCPLENTCSTGVPFCADTPTADASCGGITATQDIDDAESLQAALDLLYELADDAEPTNGQEFISRVINLVNALLRVKPEGAIAAQAQGTSFLEALFPILAQMLDDGQGRIGSPRTNSFTLVNAPGAADNFVTSPVVPATMHITITGAGGTENCVDNGAGVITCPPVVATSTAGTIVYATGALQFTYPIGSPRVAGDTATVNYLSTLAGDSGGLLSTVAVNALIQDPISAAANSRDATRLNLLMRSSWWLTQPTGLAIPLDLDGDDVTGENPGLNGEGEYSTNVPLIALLPLVHALVNDPDDNPRGLFAPGGPASNPAFVAPGSRPQQSVAEKLLGPADMLLRDSRLPNLLGQLQAILDPGTGISDLTAFDNVGPIQENPFSPALQLPSNPFSVNPPLLRVLTDLQAAQLDTNLFGGITAADVQPTEGLTNILNTLLKPIGTTAGFENTPYDPSEAGGSGSVQTDVCSEKFFSGRTPAEVVLNIVSQLLEKSENDPKDFDYRDRTLADNIPVGAGKSDNRTLLRVILDGLFDDPNTNEVSLADNADDYDTPPIGVPDHPLAGLCYDGTAPPCAPATGGQRGLNGGDRIAVPQSVLDTLPELLNTMARFGFDDNNNGVLTSIFAACAGPCPENVGYPGIADRLLAAQRLGLDLALQLDAPFRIGGGVHGIFEFEQSATRQFLESLSGLTNAAAVNEILLFLARVQEDLQPMVGATSIPNPTDVSRASAAVSALADPDGDGDPKPDGILDDLIPLVQVIPASGQTQQIIDLLRGIRACGYTPRGSDYVDVRGGDFIKGLENQLLAMTDAYSGATNTLDEPPLGVNTPVGTGDAVCPNGTSPANLVPGAPLGRGATGGKLDSNPLFAIARTPSTFGTLVGGSAGTQGAALGTFEDLGVNFALAGAGPTADLCVVETFSPFQERCNPITAVAAGLGGDVSFTNGAAPNNLDDLLTTGGLIDCQRPDGSSGPPCSYRIRQMREPYNGCVAGATIPNKGLGYTLSTFGTGGITPNGYRDSRLDLMLRSLNYLSDGGNGGGFVNRLEGLLQSVVQDNQDNGQQSIAKAFLFGASGTQGTDRGPIQALLNDNRSRAALTSFLTLFGRLANSPHDPTSNVPVSPLFSLQDPMDSYPNWNGANQWPVSPGIPALAARDTPCAGTQCDGNAVHDAVDYQFTALQGILEVLGRREGLDGFFCNTFGRVGDLPFPPQNDSPVSIENGHCDDPDVLFYTASLLIQAGLIKELIPGVQVILESTNAQGIGENVAAAAALPFGAAPPQRDLRLNVLRGHRTQINRASLANMIERGTLSGNGDRVIFDIANGGVAFTANYPENYAVVSCLGSADVTNCPVAAPAADSGILEGPNQILVRAIYQLVLEYLGENNATVATVGEVVDNLGYGARRGRVAALEELLGRLTGARDSANLVNPALTILRSIVIDRRNASPTDPWAYEKTIVARDDATEQAGEVSDGAGFTIRDVGPLLAVQAGLGKRGTIDPAGEPNKSALDVLMDFVNTLLEDPTDCAPATVGRIERGVTDAGQPFACPAQDAFGAAPNFFAAAGVLNANNSRDVDSVFRDVGVTVERPIQPIFDEDVFDALSSLLAGDDPATGGQSTVTRALPFLGAFLDTQLDKIAQRPSGLVANGDFRLYDYCSPGDALDNCTTSGTADRVADALLADLQALIPGGNASTNAQLLARLNPLLTDDLNRNGLLDPVNTITRGSGASNPISALDQDCCTVAAAGCQPALIVYMNEVDNQVVDCYQGANTPNGSLTDDWGDATGGPNNCAARCVNPARKTTIGFTAADSVVTIAQVDGLDAALFDGIADLIANEDASRAVNNESNRTSTGTQFDTFTFRTVNPVRAVDPNFVQMLTALGDMLIATNQ